MDPEKIFRFLSENVGEFFEVSVNTLRRPIAHFDLARRDPSYSGGIVSTSNSSPLVKPWLNPKLFAFAIVSIIFGNIINSLVPERRTGPEVLVTVVVTLVYWFIYSSGLYILCRILRGRGNYTDTIAVSLQLIATLFVVTSCATLLLAVIAMMPVIGDVVARAPILGEIIQDEPMVFFFLVQALLLAVYLPLALKRLHGFGWFRQVLIAIVPFLTMWCGIVMYMFAGLAGMNAL